MLEIPTELRRAILRFCRSPGICCSIILTLSLAIGANCAIFAVVSAALFHRLPYPDPRSLFVTDSRVSLSQFIEWHQRVEPIADLAAFQPTRADVTIQGVLYRNLWTCAASAELFHVLGTAPLLGRVFSDDEERHAERVIVLGHRIWSDALASDADIIGKSVLLNNTRYTVVGVMPQEFGFPESIAHSTEVWTPLGEELWSAPKQAEVLTVLARARPRISTEMIKKALEPGTARAAEEDRAAIALRPLERQVGPDFKAALLLTWAAAGLLFLMACASAAASQTARVMNRVGHLAIQLTLGAGRGRVVRELWTDAALLGVGSAALGWLCATLFIKSSTLWLPEGWIAADNVYLDRLTFVFMAATALLAISLVGIMPALHIARLDYGPLLRQAGPQPGTTAQASARGVLIFFESALTLTLLIAAGLLLRTLHKMSSTPLGFEPDHLLVIGTELPREKYPAAKDAVSALRRIRRELQNMPGIEEVGGTNALPFWGYSTVSFLPDVSSYPGHTPEPVQATMVTPDYFSAMRIRLLRGRGFLDTDSPNSAKVVIVDSFMAAQYWPEADVIGKQVFVDSGDSKGTAEIVGVVDGIRQRGFGEKMQPTLYIPYAQVPSTGITFVLRTKGAPLQYSKGVLSTLHSLEPGSSAYDITSLDRVLSKTIASQKAAAVVLGAFAVVTFAIATLGMYSLVVYVVKQRTREIGIRLALGSSGREAVLLVWRQTLRPVFGGVAFGLTASLVIMRSMTVLLYGITPRDPLTFAVSTLVLLSAAALAASAAASRVATIKPAEALRQE